MFIDKKKLDGNSQKQNQRHAKTSLHTLIYTIRSTKYINTQTHTLGVK